jgi:ferritin-like metal-binding protein YciE
MATDTNERARDIFVTGVRNAHALENQALELLNRQVERIENYPEMKARLDRHVDETQGQIQRLEQILDGLNESRSMIKDNLMALTGNMAAITHAVMQDEILKNTYANVAFENFEAASYRSLITIADNTGFRNAVPLLEQNLREELDMIQWLDQNLDTVTQRYVERELAGQKSGL